MDMVGSGNVAIGGGNAGGGAPSGASAPSSAPSAGGTGGESVIITPGAADPAPASPSAASPTGAPAAAESQPGAPSFLEAAAPEPTPQQAAEQQAQIIKLKFGDKELTAEEAQKEYAALMNRLQGADRTTAGWRERAEKAVTAATALQQILIKRGLLSPDGGMELEPAATPEQIRAGAQPKEPAYEFKVPSFSEFGDPSEVDAVLTHIERVGTENGPRFAYAMLLDLVNQQFQKFWEGFSGKEGYLNHQFGERFQRFQPFFNHLESTGARTKFLQPYQMATDEAGQPMFPELRDGALTSRLVHIMDRLPEDFRHTEEGFDTAITRLRYELYRESLQPGGGQPAAGALPAPPPPPPVRLQPPLVLDAAAPSGIPRPRPANGGAVDDGSHLLSKKGVAGGINWL